MSFLCKYIYFGWVIVLLGEKIKTVMVFLFLILCCVISIFTLTTDNQYSHNKITGNVILTSIESNVTLEIWDSTDNESKETGEKVWFYGNGTDEDGTIEGYNWSSNIDGFLSSKKSFSRFMTSTFMAGSSTT